MEVIRMRDSNHFHSNLLHSKFEFQTLSLDPHRRNWVSQNYQNEFETQKLDAEVFWVIKMVIADNSKFITDIGGYKRRKLN